MSKSKSRESIFDESMLYQVIDHLPYPVAIFERSGFLVAANREMMKLACLKKEDFVRKRVNFLDRIPADQEKLREAVADVFAGETTMVREVSEPLSIFHGSNASEARNSSYRSAVLFPVFIHDGFVSHGAAMLMK